MLAGAAHFAAPKELAPSIMFGPWFQTAAILLLASMKGEVTPTAICWRRDKVDPLWSR